MSVPSFHVLRHHKAASATTVPIDEIMKPMLILHNEFITWKPLRETPEEGVFLTTNQALIWAAEDSYSREVVGGGKRVNRHFNSIVF